MSLRERISNFQPGRQCVLLCVGPMSRNCVDAALELSAGCEAPLVLIASRRQIDSAEFNGGYVSNWTTDNFVSYVRRRGQSRNVVLERDHGGPWQNDSEAGMDLKAAMASAKRSYETDIRCGISIIHIDPSLDPSGNLSTEQYLERTFELYEFCHDVSQKVGAEIIFEVGSDLGDPETRSPDESEYALSRILDFCTRKKIPSPLFFAARTGTKVIETRNIVQDQSLTKIVAICNERGVYLKEHNADYLEEETLKRHFDLGVHSANVAPELGVTESRKLIELLETHSLLALKNEFVSLALKSRKWEKWLGRENECDNLTKALIAGHYVFASTAFEEIKRDVARQLKRKRIDLDEELKNAVKKTMGRYLTAFNLAPGAGEI